MNRSRFAVPAFILSAVLLAACASVDIMHINREYRMPAALESVIALYPTTFHLQTTDDALHASFTKLTSFKQVLSPGEVRKRQRISAQVHEALRKGGDSVPLKLILPESQYSYLVTSLAPANLILFPMEIKLTPSGQATYANISYRLYDLKTGILLMRSSFELRTDAIGMKAEIAIVAKGTDRMAQEVMAALASR